MSVTPREGEKALQKAKQVSRNGLRNRGVICVLIDNSTLSGVERITGESQTLNLSNTDNDILCFEKLTSAILFSDTLFGVDDYKEKYRHQRLRKFSYIEFIRLPEDEYRWRSKDAATFAREMIFSFEGSRPAGDVLHFFEALQVDPQMRWDVWTSSEYLTLSYLVEDRDNPFRENAVTAALGNELADKSAVDPQTPASPHLDVQGNAVEDIKELIRSFSNNNSNFKGQGSGSVLEKMIFGYGWAAERSKFYASIASSMDCGLSLSPMRDAFCESCCRIDYPNQIASLMQKVKSATQETVAAIVGPSGDARFAMKMPFFTSYFISKTDTPSSALQMALNYRQKPELIECRDLLSNLKHLNKGDRVQEVNKILRHVDRSLTALLNKYAVLGSQGQAFSVSLGISGPELSKEIKLSSLFPDFRNRPFATFFRSMATDMVNVERMGSLYDKMLSQRRKHADAMYPRLSLTPHYLRGKSSEYGRPAQPYEEN